MDDAVKKKLIDFFTHFSYHHYKKGEILIRADDDPAGVFFLEDGIVRKYYISKKGDEVTLNMFKRFSFFPSSWVVNETHNDYFYEAMTDCRVYRAPRSEVLALLKREPDITFNLLQRVYRGIEGLMLHIEYLSSGNSVAKLSATLLILSKRFGKKTDNTIVIPFRISEKELGEYAGMYRETVSRAFSSLRKNGFISYEKGIITILAIDKLEESLSL